MNRRTTLILAGLALAFTAFNVYLGWREREARAQQAREKRLFQLALKEVDGFEIYRGREAKAEAIFRRGEDGVWTVTLPDRMITDTADAKALEELLAVIELASLRPAEKVTPADAGLEDPENQILFIARSGKEVEETLIVGAVSPGGKARYVARGSRPDEVHAMHADLLRIFDRDPLTFRSLDLFDLNRSQITRVELNPGGTEGEKRSIVFKLEPEGWYLTRPVRWPAAEEELGELLRLCQTLRAESVIADKVDDPGVFGLGHSAPHIVLQVEGKEQEVRFGREAPGASGIHAMRRGRSPIYVVSKVLAQRLSQGLDEPDWYNRYRSRELRLIPDVQPATIFLQNPDGTSLVLTRGDAEGAWRASGTRSFAVEGKVVEEYVQGMRQIRIKGFPAERQVDLAGYGLQPFARRVACTDPANRQLVGFNLSGGDKQGRFYMTVDGLPQVLEIEPRSAIHLLAAEIVFRSRQLVDFDWESVGDVRISGPAGKRVYRWITGNNFQVVEPKTQPLAEDAVRFVGLVNYLSRLRCQEFYAEKADDLSKFGLDQGRIRVIVTLRSGKGDRQEPVALDLIIGHPVRELHPNIPESVESAFGRLAGERTVFILDGKLVKELEREYK